MATFEVEVARSITCTVKVEADDPEAAMDVVEKSGFQLPDRDEWHGGKNWSYRVYGPGGIELGERG